MPDLGFFVRLRRRLHGHEGGFTLIEMMAAIMILFIVLTSIAYTATIDFKYAALARQRQAANAYSAQYMEQARALAFSVLVKGMNSTSSQDPNFATDPNILTGASCTGQGAASPCIKVPDGTYEALDVNSGTNGNTANLSVSPLVPHQYTNKPSGSATTYTTDIYVTKYKNGSTGFRVVVVTSWSPADVRGVSASLPYQSIFSYTGGGCSIMGTKGHPFSGPCSAFLYSQSVVPQGTIKVAGTLAGSSLDNATLYLPATTANIQSEQIQIVQGVESTSGGSLTSTGNPAQTIGDVYMATEADNDLSQPSNPVSQKGVGLGSPAVVDTYGACGSGNDLVLGDSSESQIDVCKSAADLTTTDPNGAPGSSTTSSVDATKSPKCANQTDNQPCGYATSLSGGTKVIALKIMNGNTLVGTCNIVSVGTPTTASWTLADRTNPPDPTQSPYTTAQLQRNFPQVTIGCLPTSTVPANFNSLPAGFSGGKGFLVGIGNGFQGALTAEAGYTSGVSNPTGTMTGTAYYWNGSAYSSTVGGTPTLTFTDPTSGCVFTESAGQVIDPGAISVPPSTAGSVAGTISNSTGTFSPPLDGTYTLNVTCGPQTVANLTVTTNLGTATASTQYQPPGS